MALNPVNEAHALQIQAGILGRQSGHSFEDQILQRESIESHTQFMFYVRAAATSCKAIRANCSCITLPPILVCGKSVARPRFQPVLWPRRRRENSGSQSMRQASLNAKVTWSSLSTAINVATSPLEFRRSSATTRPPPTPNCTSRRLALLRHFCNRMGFEVPSVRLTHYANSAEIQAFDRLMTRRFSRREELIHAGISGKK